MKHINERRRRAEQINELIAVIASCGRRFFHHQGRVAHMEVDDRGRVWWLDHYTKKRVYTHVAWLGGGFCGGGTLNHLVREFRDFIMTGKPVPANSFGPWSESCCGGDLWGYGADMEKVRAASKVVCT